MTPISTSRCSSAASGRLSAGARARTCKPLGEFDVEKDIRFYDDEPQCYYTLRPGQFTILLPEDAHAPMVGEGAIRKIIVKVRK